MGISKRKKMAKKEENNKKSGNNDKSKNIKSNSTKGAPRAPQEPNETEFKPTPKKSKQGSRKINKKPQPMKDKQNKAQVNINKRTQVSNSHLEQNNKFSKKNEPSRVEKNKFNN